MVADQDSPNRPSALDKSLLAKRGFNAEEYIANSLSSASEEDVEQFYDNLKRLRATTSSDLQSNVFNNYSSFVSLSHEISTLATDLSSLSSLLLQFSTTTQSLSSLIQKDDPVSDSSRSFQRERRGAQHHR